MVNENHLKKWFLMPIPLSVILLLSLSVFVGSIVDLLFFWNATGGFYWLRFLFEVTFALAGPLSLLIICFMKMMELTLMEIFFLLFVGVGLTGWWVFCVRRAPFMIFFPILFWTLIGTFLYVMAGLMSV